VLNAAASALVGLQFGADIEAIRDALARAVLPERRNQRVIEGEVVVINDYAHHPTAIKALIQTPRPERKGRLRAVFQPHRYTRTKALLDEFAGAFKGVDELVLVPVYAASEAPLSGGGTHDLYASMRSSGALDRILYSRSLSGAWEYFRKTLEPGDVLLVIGAGDVEQIGYWLRRDFSEGRREQLREAFELLGKDCDSEELKLDCELGKRTVFGSGGAADACLEVGSVESLSRVWAFCNRQGVRMHIMGAGGNIVVSDLGVRGVTARMSGEVFGELSAEAGLIHAGSAVTIGRLLDCAEENGLSGLEFLEGMPGVVGGVVKMNAGAYGGEVGELLEEIVCLDSDGRQVVLGKDDITYAYRSMTCLQGRIVTSASFRCTKSSREAVAAKREEIRAKRGWMKGMRSVGSVFRNPPGQYAGKLIEDCGFKGLKVGGVGVSEEHANIFVNDGSGTSSDMICLIDMICTEVRMKTGVVLEREVVILE
jgi:UDP-N-acetylenolpyruvoylglucosamine reductase